LSTVNENPLIRIQRAFWSRFSDPSAVVLGRAILSLLVLAETLICVFWIFTLSGLGDGYAFMAAVPYVYIVVSYVTLFIFYHYKRFGYFIFIQLVMLLVMPFFMQWVIGGFEASSGVAIWAILSPVGALMILGTTQSTPWFALFMGLAAVSWQLNTLFASNALPIPGNVKDTFFVMNLSGVATILYIVMRYFQSQKQRVLAALEVEQARSEKLLLNILPQSVAKRLKTNETRIADSHAAVTIMFADLVDFTKLSAKLPPAELVDLLNGVFSEFDRLTEKYGLEKIKTIGDAYMAVAGAPNARPDHAHAVAGMALEMQATLAEISSRLNKNLMMRIGINSGPVVAGVIGSTKFSYDLWGDTVNLASRMEQSGIPNGIQVTEATYKLLEDDYDFESRGMIPLKGKGETEAYILKGRKNKAGEPQLFVQSAD
jgi:guanylate cyclase